MSHCTLTREQETFRRLARREEAKQRDDAPPPHTFLRVGAVISGVVRVTIAENDDESSFEWSDESFSSFATPHAHRHSHFGGSRIPVAVLVDGDDEEDCLSATYPDFMAGPQSEQPVVEAIRVDVDSRPRRRTSGFERVFRKLKRLFHLRRSPRRNPRRRIDSSSSSELQAASPLSHSSPPSLNPPPAPSSVNDKSIRLGCGYLACEDRDSSLHIVLHDREKGDKEKTDEKGTYKGGQGEKEAGCKQENAAGITNKPKETGDTIPPSLSLPGGSNPFGADQYSINFCNSAVTLEAVASGTPSILHDSGFAEDVVVAEKRFYVGRGHDEQSEPCDILRHIIKSRFEAIRKFDEHASHWHSHLTSWKAESTMPSLIIGTSFANDAAVHDSTDANTSCLPSVTSASTADLERVEETVRKELLLEMCMSLSINDRLELVDHLVSELGHTLGQRKHQETETAQWHGRVYSILRHTLKYVEKIQQDCTSPRDSKDPRPSEIISDLLAGDLMQHKELQLQQKLVEDKPCIKLITRQEHVIEELGGAVCIIGANEELISDRSFVDDNYDVESDHSYFVPPNYLSESHEHLLCHHVRYMVDHLRHMKTFLARLLDDDETVPGLEPLLESPPASQSHHHQGQDGASTAPAPVPSDVKDVNFCDLQSSTTTSTFDESWDCCPTRACPGCFIDGAAVAESHRKPVSELKQGVVLVGLWDAMRSVIAWVGSGFVVDPHLGLVVTAAHVLFDLGSQGRNFGSCYYGLKDAKVVLGVLNEESNVAVYRYCGGVILDGIRNGVDACVVRITCRLGKDVDDEGPDYAFHPRASQPEIPHDLEKEPLCALSLAKQSDKQCFQAETHVRVIGYNQEGEGVFIPGTHLNRMVDYARGEICGKFESRIFRNSSNLTDQITAQMSFCPREEIITTCRTMAGHSGGPCVNDEGLVIGILSRGTRDRSYLVPSWELWKLVERAKSSIR